MNIIPYNPELIKDRWLKEAAYGRTHTGYDKELCVWIIQFDDNFLIRIVEAKKSNVSLWWETIRRQAPMSYLATFEKDDDAILVVNDISKEQLHDALTKAIPTGLFLWK